MAPAPAVHATERAVSSPQLGPPTSHFYFSKRTRHVNCASARRLSVICERGCCCLLCAIVPFVMVSVCRCHLRLCLLLFGLCDRACVSVSFAILSVCLRAGNAFCMPRARPEGTFPSTVPPICEEKWPKRDGAPIEHETVQF